LKTIVVVCSYARSLIDFRGTLLTSFIEKGFEVFALAPVDAEFARIQDRLATKRIQLLALDLDRNGLNPWVDIKAYYQIRKFFKDLKPSFVVAYTAKPVVYCGLAVRFIEGCSYFPLITGLGYAFTEGHGFKRRLVRWLSSVLYVKALASAKTVIFQNPDDKDLFLSLGILAANASVGVVNGSGVDLSVYRPLKIPDKPVFLMVSRILVDKGVREYVMAAQIVHQQYPEVVFLLAGGMDPNPAGIKWSEIKTWIASGSIQYLGEVRPISDALKKCRYFVLPSYREGTPRSVLEALASGRPVITTDVPGCRQTVINGVNGYLVKPRDSRDLANSMIMMLENSNEILRAQALASLQIARDRFDVEKVNAQIFKIMGLES
jgi:glycosyltransferase involved in cell wall biosynthesis